MVSFRRLLYLPKNVGLPGFAAARRRMRRHAMTIIIFLIFKCCVVDCADVFAVSGYFGWGHAYAFILRQKYFTSKMMGGELT
jgi:hypothetical protein